jgi:hypothetical protein
MSKQFVGPANNNGSGRVKVFFSYAHRDERLRSALDQQLAPLKRSGLILSWHDFQIIPGQNIHKEIEAQLQSADLIILLVSPDFMASEYCYSKELKIAMERHATGAVEVIPVILRPVDWQEAPFGNLRALPRDGRPVVVWKTRDSALLDAALGIKAAVEQIARRQTQR